MFLCRKQYFSVRYWLSSQVQSMSYFTRIELEMAQLSAGYESKQVEFTIVLTEFSLCSTVTLGLGKLDGV